VKKNVAIRHNLASKLHFIPQMKRILFIALIISSINMMAIDGASSINNNEIKIESNIIKPVFDVYPNPATGNEILINLKDFKNNAGSTLTISNVIGQVLFTYHITQADIENGSFKINLSENEIRKGMYFLKLSSGEQSTLKKLVVK
jgi:hypothetical protein